MKSSFITSELSSLKKSGSYNNIPIIESPIGASITIDGKQLLNFCSNNYLGLANNSKIKKAAQKAIDKFGVGPAAVRSIAGTMSLHIELEKAIAKFKKCESAIVVQSGFTANLAAIPTFVGKEDFIFSDELNHASIIDACRLSGAQIIRYKHANTKDLEDQLKKAPKVGKKLIVTDGVFSMDGDIAPLPEIAKIAKKYKCILMVDDAHGEGVLGKSGRGIVDHFGLHGKVDIEVGTLSKAFGVVGGFITGQKDTIEYLKQRARPFLFSSALTIPDTAASIESVKILSGSDKLVKRLWQNADYLKTELKLQGFDIGKSQTPIIPVIIGEVDVAHKFSAELKKQGIFAKALGYPTVPMGTARIRVMVSAAHTKSDLDKAVSAFKTVGVKFGLIK